MTLFRTIHDKNNPYTLINKKCSEDERLSWKAKGIWMYAFSRPDDWEFYLADLIKRSKDGIDSIKTGLKELEENGYLHRKARQNKEDGKMEGWEWYFFETPKSDEEIKKMFPKEGKSLRRKNPPTENPTLLNKECSINKDIKKDNVPTMPYFLKNVSDPKKSAGHNQKNSKNVSDPKKSAGHCDPKKSAGINNVTLPINFTKDNVPTMPSSKERKNFKVYLTPEQRKLHDKLVKYQTKHGDQLRTEDVCAWFLDKKYSTQEVEKAFKVYQQRARKGSLNGREAENMGGLMVWAIKNKIEPENEDMSFNRDFAEKMCKKYSFLEMTKNYVKVQFGNVSENIMLNLPKNTFSSQLENFVNSAEFNSYV
jgi:hypothetical protein